jgi:phosphoribosyl-AMP cyclohydrolase / phosphoribosyl-ATP pyrophosphohydrolase
MTVLDPAVAARLKRDADGLVPAVVQQHDSLEVLMVGWMDDEALHRTLTTGRTTFWSRSRQEYWVKGETSGHRQWVKEVRLDCDGDTLLVLVDQEGPACHTGARTCFHNGELQPPAPHEALPALERTPADRASWRPHGSYTVELLDDPPMIGAKVREEAEEVARAAREESDDRVDEEAADVLYHLTVLLHSRGRALHDAQEVLNGRRR